MWSETDWEKTYYFTRQFTNINKDSPTVFYYKLDSVPDTFVSYYFFHMD